MPQSESVAMRARATGFILLSTFLGKNTCPFRRGQGVLFLIDNRAVREMPDR
jgi:hypothetical protein